MRSESPSTNTGTMSRGLYTLSDATDITRAMIQTDANRAMIQTDTSRAMVQQSDTIHDTLPRSQSRTNSLSEYDNCTI